MSASSSSGGVIPSSAALLASLDPAARRAFVRANDGLHLRERFNELSTDSAAPGDFPPPAKRSKAEKATRIDPAHAWALQPVGDDSVADRKALKAVLALARRPPFIDPSRLRTDQVDALCLEAWSDDLAPRQARARNEWEEDVIAGLSSRLKQRKRALDK